MMSSQLRSRFLCRNRYTCSRFVTPFALWPHTFCTVMAHTESSDFKSRSPWKGRDDTREGDVGQRMSLCAKCPDCARTISLGCPRRIWIFACPHCSALLEVVQLDPPVLNWVYPELLEARETNAYGWSDPADATEAHSWGGSSSVAIGGSRMWATEDAVCFETVSAAS